MTTDIREIELWLENEMPKVYFTLDQSKDFFIRYNSKRLDRYHLEKKFKLSVEELAETIEVISILKEIDIEYLKRNIKHWKYYTPIAIDFISNFRMLELQPVRIAKPIKMEYLSYLNSSSFEKESWFKEKAIKSTYHSKDRLPHDSDRVNSMDRYTYYKDERENLSEEEYEFLQGLDINENNIQKIIKIPFATNRRSEDGKFTSESDIHLSFGVAEVSIPANHKKFNIERPADFYFFQFREDKKKHFVIDTLHISSQDDFFRYIVTGGRKKVCIFIHGYNVSFNNAIFSAAQLKHDVLFDVETVLFSWPSKGKVRLGYAHDREMAIRSSRLLRNLLNDISNLGFEDVFIIAHSMGTFCLSEALEQINPQIKETSRVLLTASDIATKTFIEMYADKFIDTFSETSIYASSKDIALKLSSRGNSHSRVGDATPLCLYKGIHTIDVSNCDHKFWSFRHSYHSKHDSVVLDIRKMLVGKLQPHLRGLINNIDTNGLEYWVMQ
jgi:esterase/lipase superfamily enzyme